MSRLKYMASAVLAAMAIYSCDDDVSSIGNTLTDEGDKLDINATTFDVSTRTVVADSVFTLSTKCYFGWVRDPQTQADVKSEFTTQFHILELMYISPDSLIVGRYNGMAAADSCEVSLFLGAPFDKTDSLQALKMKVSELAVPIEEGQHFYSNFNPRAMGLICADGLTKNKVFTYTNLSDNDSIRSISGYRQNICIRLDQPYTARDGVVYNNYGTYILQQYYKHPEYFRNSYTFTHNVCPGLFFEITDGRGFHSQATHIGLRTYYRVRTDTSVVNYVLTLGGTQEVLQTTLVTNDKEAIRNLAKETQHTYLKSPAGLFTEVTLPVEAIKQGHENDSLLAAKISFQRINNQSDDKRMFGIPSTILMVQTDSLSSFFENTKSADGKTSFIASYNSSSTQNLYTFTNISNLVTAMWNNREAGLKKNANWIAEHPNWNKVLLVPVNSTSVGVEHDMSLTSTRLVGGQDNPNDPLKISVVYAKFTEK
jgi:hypothetical protein